MPGTKTRSNGSGTYIAAANDEVRGLGSVQLAELSLGKTKKAQEARDEIVRRFVNKHLSK